MNLVRLISLLLYTAGVFTFGALFVLWLRGVRRRQAGRRNGSEAVGRVNLVEGAFSFVTVVWFALLLLLTLSSLSPDLAPDPIQDAIFAVAFLFPPLLLHFFSDTAECSTPASSRVAVEGQRVDPKGPRAARVSWRRGWTVSFWALYALGPAMSLVVIVIGYRFVRLPPVGTLDVGATYSLFYSAANILLCVLLTVAMVYGSLGLAKSKQRRERPKQRTSPIGMRGMFGIMIGLMVLAVLRSLGVVRFGELMRTVLYSLPLLSCFGFTYLTDRYTFFDLIIKRGLSLLLTILVLTTYFSVILPGLNGFEFA